MNFFDLKKQYVALKQEIDQAILDVLKSGIFIGGARVDEFEAAIAKLIGVKHAIGLNSGTDALYIALRASGVGPGDEVITTPFTFIATAETIAACGAKPVFADIDSKTFNIDASKIEAAITQKTKAIIPVHLYGQMADMGRVMDVAKKHNLKVIEDCAQAIGAETIIRGEKKNAGTLGDAGCFSFFPTKNLGAYGDGGMLVTNNDDIASKGKIMRAHGGSPENRYKHLTLGVNSRLDAVQAAILSVKTKYLAGWNAKRAEIAAYYNARFESINEVTVPFVAEGNNHVYHQYTIRAQKRNELQEFLVQKGIPVIVYYPIALHLQEAFAYLGCRAGDFPEAERAAKEVISFPIYPEFDRADQEIIAAAVEDFYA